MKLNLFRGERRRLLVDTLVVLVGVLAALFLNNIRENAVTDRAARAATERLMEEVARNAESLRATRTEVGWRMSRLEELKEQVPADKSLRDLALHFSGFWTVDLSTSAWDYLSRSALADAVDPALLQDAFALYKFNRSFERLNDQTQSFVLSEAFVSEEKTRIAIDASGIIMWQQVHWVDELLPQYEQFLARYSAGAE